MADNPGATARYSEISKTQIDAGARSDHRMDSSFLTANARPALLGASIGALSFWVPDVAVHARARHSFDARHVWAINLLMPATFLITYLLGRGRARVTGFKWLGLAMIVGVWLTGGLFIMLSATAEGGGFATARAVTSILLVVGSVIPIVTCMLATYDGSLGALLIVTAVAVLIWAYGASGLREALSHRGKATP